MRVSPSPASQPADDHTDQADHTEHAVVAAILAGDPTAGEELVRRFQAPVRALARRLAPSPDQADDLAQEVFLQALADLPRWRGEGDLVAWLRGIVRNQARLQWRRQTQRTRHERDQLAEYIELVAVEVCTLDPLIAAEQQRALHACLEALSEKGRRLIDLRHRHGLSCGAIADTVQTQVGAVRTSLCRLHQRLRACVELRLHGERPDV